MVFGHSHLPLHEERDGFAIFNPGSPTERRRAPRHTMGIATVDGGRVAFELVESGLTGGDRGPAVVRRGPAPVRVGDGDLPPTRNLVASASTSAPAWPCAPAARSSARVRPAILTRTTTRLDRAIRRELPSRTRTVPLRPVRSAVRFEPASRTAAWMRAFVDCVVLISHTIDWPVLDSVQETSTVLPGGPGGPCGPCGPVGPVGPAGPWIPADPAGRSDPSGRRARGTRAVRPGPAGPGDPAGRSGPWGRSGPAGRRRR